LKKNKPPDFKPHNSGTLWANPPNMKHPTNPENFVKIVQGIREVFIFRNCVELFSVFGGHTHPTPAPMGWDLAWSRPSQARVKYTTVIHIVTVYYKYISIKQQRLVWQHLRCIIGVDESKFHPRSVQPVAPGGEKSRNVPSLSNRQLRCANADAGNKLWRLTLIKEFLCHRNWKRCHTCDRYTRRDVVFLCAQLLQRIRLFIRRCLTTDQSSFGDSVVTMTTTSAMN